MSFWRQLHGGLQAYLVTPVVYALLVIDFLAKTVDDCAWRPLDLLWPLLLLDHLVENGHDPVFECAVVRVGHEQVTDTIQADL